MKERKRATRATVGTSMPKSQTATLVDDSDSSLEFAKDEPMAEMDGGYYVYETNPSHGHNKRAIPGYVYDDRFFPLKLRGMHPECLTRHRQTTKWKCIWNAKRDRRRRIQGDGVEEKNGGTGKAQGQS